MKAEYIGEFFLSASDANAEGKLSLTVLSDKIIDVATRHANSLGIGNPVMAHLNAGWILSRLTIEMHNYPEVNAGYRIKTWIEDFNRHFSTRCFSIETKDGEVLGYARSIWLVMDAINHTNFGTSHLSLPQEVVTGIDVPIARQEKHIPILPKDSSDGERSKYLIATHPASGYTFKYCDLDSYRHVNTVKYITLLLNQFTLQQHDETTVERLELSFLHEASYGMEITLLRSDSISSPLLSSFQLSDASDGKILLFARIERKATINPL